MNLFITWNMEEDWFPSQAWLNAFDYVVWETGNARDPLSEDEQVFIRNYLEAAGNLLIIGQYIGDDHGDSEFFAALSCDFFCGPNRDLRSVECLGCQNACFETPNPQKISPAAS